jgi:hypothetical protein
VPWRRPALLFLVVTLPGRVHDAVVDDSIVIHLPRRDWAISALDDLRGEGCRGVLVGGPDCDGQWALQVTGPAEKIAMMRYEMNLDANRICWEQYINGLALA